MPVSHHPLLRACLLLCAGMALLSAVEVAPPPMLTAQGRITEAGNPVNGQRSFSFAIIASDGTTVLWSTPSLNLTVVNGLYAVVLGSTSLGGMPAIPPSILTQTGLSLKVAVNGAPLLPNVAIIPALQADIAYSVAPGSVSDGGITSVSWGKITGTPSTLAGYGIGDAVRRGSSGPGTISAGIGTPSGGQTGDLYIATDTQQLYQLAAGGWMLISAGRRPRTPGAPPGPVAPGRDPAGRRTARRAPRVPAGAVGAAGPAGAVEAARICWAAGRQRTSPVRSAPPVIPGRTRWCAGAHRRHRARRTCRCSRRGRRSRVDRTCRCAGSHRRHRTCRCGRRRRTDRTRWTPGPHRRHRTGRPRGCAGTCRSERRGRSPGSARRSRTCGPPRPPGAAGSSGRDRRCRTAGPGRCDRRHPGAHHRQRDHHGADPRRRCGRHRGGPVRRPLQHLRDGDHPACRRRTPSPAAG